MKRKKVLLVSLDALGETDYEDLCALPHFAKLMEQGAWCKQVNSVYPSVTFPCHASIVTGCLPAQHGIVNNYIFEPYSTAHHWNFYASNLKRKALWDYAQDHHLRVLSMSWPVSSGAKMTYSMPEMSPAKPRIWNAQHFFAQLNVMRKYGTPFFAIKTMLGTKGLTKAWFFGSQPALDQKMIKSFKHQIAKKDFDIGLLHIYGLDDAKHQYGPTSEAVKGYLERYDQFVGDLMDYCDQRQKTESITLVVTGDHAQKPVQWTIYGNMILADLGLVEYEKDCLKHYRVYLDSCDGMAYLYLNQEKDQVLVSEIVEAFRLLPGVAKVMLPDQFASSGCDRQAVAVLEAADGYHFDSGYCSAAKTALHHTIASHYRGIHGYEPDQPGYHTMTGFYGQDVQPQQIDDMCITDILPSLLAWLGIQGEQMDGRALTKLWKK